MLISTNLRHKSGLILTVAILAACGKGDVKAKAGDSATVPPSAANVESGDPCNLLEPYLKALPTDSTMNGMALAERGCKQPISVQSRYVTGENEVSYYIDVLDSALVTDIPDGGKLIETNVKGVEANIGILKSQIDIASHPDASITPEERKKLPMVVKLANGDEAIVTDASGWQLIALVKGKYSVKIELPDPAGNILDTQTAQAKLLPFANKINFAALK